MEEAIETADPYRIVITGLDMCKNTVRFLISVTRTATDMEKQDDEMQLLIGTSLLTLNDHI